MFLVHLCNSICAYYCGCFVHVFFQWLLNSHLVHVFGSDTGKIT